MMFSKEISYLNTLRNRSINISATVMENEVCEKQ